MSVWGCERAIYDGGDDASYDDGDLATIQRVTELWGTETLHQIGKLFQKHNMLRMRRRVTKIDSDVSLTTRKVGAKATG